MMAWLCAPRPERNWIWSRAEDSTCFVYDTHTHTHTCARAAARRQSRVCDADIAHMCTVYTKQINWISSLFCGFTLFKLADMNDGINVRIASVALSVFVTACAQFRILFGFAVRDLRRFKFSMLQFKFHTFRTLTKLLTGTCVYLRLECARWRFMHAKMSLFPYVRRSVPQTGL